MKKTIWCGLLLVFVFLAFSCPLLAQTGQTEALALTKKFEQAYNKKDVEALKALYTKDATITNPDGTVVTGSAAIGTYYGRAFGGYNSVILTLTGEKSTTAPDGTTTATGRYLVRGTIKTSGAFYVKGSYTNTLVKEKGQWKISKSVLTAL